MKKEKADSEARAESASRLESVIRSLKEKAEDSNAQAKKALDKAYKDLGKIIEKANKATEKVLAWADKNQPPDLENLVSVLSQAKLPALKKKHDSEESRLTHYKVLQAIATAGFLDSHEGLLQSFLDKLLNPEDSAVTAFKYDHKESKKTKVEKLTKHLREQTGLGRGVSEAIADAVIRGREVERLALQKGWPIEDGEITGPTGTVSLRSIALPTA